MKLTCFVLLAVILSFELHAQTNFCDLSQLDIQPLKLKNTTGKFEESNYHIDIDYAPVINVSETYTFRDYVHTLWGYYDVSIAEKVLYFRLETGVIADWKFNGGAGFAAIGVN
jgi:hypothetical protein